jgi:hypothetical protein
MFGGEGGSEDIANRLEDLMLFESNAAHRQLQEKTW